MIVVDTSVVLKWLRTKDEPFLVQASILLQNHLTKKQPILVPQLLFIEVANALVTKVDSIEEEIQENLAVLYSSKLNVYEVVHEDIDVSSQLAKKYKTSVYDMLYAVIAKKHKTILYTADNRFITRTKFRHVKHVREVIMV